MYHAGLLKSYSRWVLFGFLILNLFLSFKLHSIYTWESALDWLKSVDFSNPNITGHLYLNHNLLQREPNVDGYCQALWQSRLSASHDLDLAGKWLLQADGCNRSILVASWSGQLAWLQGNRRIALSEWFVLPDINLLNWGRNLIRYGDVDQGEFILQHLALGAYSDLSPHNQAQLFLALGDSFLTKKNLSKAVASYERAWQIEQSYFIAYKLGNAYMQFGDYSTAVEVLETGLAFKGNGFRPFLDSSYLIVLGECYEQINQVEKAKKNYDLALQILGRANRQEFNGVEDRIAWIKRLRNTLTTVP